MIEFSSCWAIRMPTDAQTRPLTRTEEPGGFGQREQGGVGEPGKKVEKGEREADGNRTGLDGDGQKLELHDAGCGLVVGTILMLQ